LQTALEKFAEDRFSISTEMRPAKIIILSSSVTMRGSHVGDVRQAD